MILYRTNLFLNFDYFISCHFDEIKNECISNLRRNQTHNIEYPKTYNEHNTGLTRIFHPTDCIEKELYKTLSMKQIISVSSICQMPGHVIPPHLDTFYFEKQDNPDVTILRANVFLQDCKIGHSLQILNDNDIKDSGVYTAGDTWIWDSNIFHCSANAGFDPKYTLQITGILEEDAEFLY